MALNLYERTRRRRIYDITVTWKNLNLEMDINNINPYRARIAYEDNPVQIRKKQSDIEELNQEKKAIENNIKSIKDDIESLIKQGASSTLIRSLKNRLQDVQLALQNVEAEIDSAKSKLDDFVSGKEYYKIREKDSIENFNGLRIDFEVNRSIYGGASDLTLRIYNLSLENRERLYADNFLYGIYKAEYKAISFKAGYEGDGLIKLFNGFVKNCYSYKQGQDIITELYCVSNTTVVEHLAQGYKLDQDTPRIDVIRKLIGNLYNITEGFIDTDSLNPAPVKKGTIIGNTPVVDLRIYATNKSGQQLDMFIDNQKIYLLDRKHGFIPNKALVQSISSDVELIGTPMRSGSIITLNCIFLPRVELAQVFYLNSQVETAFSDILNPQRNPTETAQNELGLESKQLPDAIYKILSIHHKGTISDTSAEAVTTTLTFTTQTHHFKSIVAIPKGV